MRKVSRETISELLKKNRLILVGENDKGYKYWLDETASKLYRSYGETWQVMNKRKTREGYYYWCVRKKWIYAHRLIHFRSLQEEENNKNLDVHHLDGDKEKNKRENLQALTRSEHKRIHSKPRISPNGNRIPLGVYRSGKNKWRAKLFIDGEYRVLGNLTAKTEREERVVLAILGCVVDAADRIIGRTPFNAKIFDYSSELKEDAREWLENNREKLERIIGAIDKVKDDLHFKCWCWAVDILTAEGDEELYLHNLLATTDRVSIQMGWDLK